MRLAGIVGACAVGSVVTILFLAPQESSATPQQLFAKLESDMEAAQRARLESRSTGESAHAAKPDPSNDPRLDILKRMDALAEKTAGTTDGGYINIQTFVWSWMLDLDLDYLFERFARAAGHYPNDPFLGEPLGMVPAAHVVSATPAKWIDTLGRLARESKVDATRWTALLVMGQIQLAAKMPADAKASFDRVIQSAPDSDIAIEAKGLLYELEHLQPGMLAPLFTAESVDGKPVSLASLRGKTVLLNFWASW
jgi:hypothetical protein